MISRAVQVWSLMYPDGIKPDEYEFALSLALRAGVTNGHANGNLAEAQAEVAQEIGMSVREAAKLVKRNTATIYAAIKSKKLPTIKSPDGRMLVSSSDVRAWAES